MQHAPAGTHCILELFECDARLLNDESLIRSSLTEAASEAMSTLLSLTSKRFDPQGVTALALLAESHLSIHTWPEHGYAAVDAFTCGAESRPAEACRLLAKRLGAGRLDLRTFDRGGELPATAKPVVPPPADEVAGAPSRRTHAPADASEELALCQVRN